MVHINHSFPIQPTRQLHVRRVADGWVVWLLGSPHTPHHTYLYLRDDGRMERVTEGGGEIHVLHIKEE